MIEQFKANLADIHRRIDDAANRSGRTSEDVTLIAVTKYVGIEETRALVNAGCTNLGESRPQLLWEKCETLSEMPIQWHMIGHLQRNKVKRTVQHAHLIHSVDSHRLMTAIDAASREQGKVAKLLFEVNVSGEEAKHGFRDAELGPAIEFARSLENIAVHGLMCMAGLASDADGTRREFATLRALREQHQSNCGGNIEMSELSMGMSGDFEIAIEEGATMVRVGSLLFHGISK